MLPHPPVRRAAAVDLELLAVLLDHHPGDVRGRRLVVVELDAVGLGPPDRALLLLARLARGTRSRSCTHLWAITNAPPAPGSPSGTSATSSASSTGGFSVPSMKPVRSRLSRYTKHGCSAASVGHRREHGGDRPRATSSSTSSPVPWIHTQMSCWVAGARRPSPSIASNGASSAGASSGSQPAPEVGAEAHHDVRPAGGDRRLRRPPSAATIASSVAPGRRSNSRW